MNSPRAGEGAPEPRPARALLLQALLIVGIWLALGTFFGLQMYLNASAGGRPIELAVALDRSIRRYLIYAVLTFPCLWLCRRFPLTSRRWGVSLLAHATVLAGFMVLFAALRLLVGPVMNASTGQPLPLSYQTGLDIIRSNFFEQFWMYASIVAVILSIQHYRQLRERELREADLQRQMAEYELQVLKLQLHPHFLFNTLNGIATLMLRDVRTARAMLVRLSDLLRVALARSRDDEVSLRDELAFVTAYLELEQMRFGERLQVRQEIDPDALDARVPNMLIQPLVENAIQYGIAQLRTGGTLGLAADCGDGKVRIRIVNDGPALAEDPHPAGGSADEPHPSGGSGIGLGNSRARLWRLYGDAYRLRIVRRLEGGAEVFLEVPLRRAAVPAAAGA